MDKTTIAEAIRCARIVADGGTGEQALRFCQAFAVIGEADAFGPTDPPKRRNRRQRGPQLRVLEGGRGR